MTIWGDIALDGARRTVTVEREFAASAPELWDALTRPSRLADWIGAYEETADGFRLSMGGLDVDALVAGRVIACEPERRILVGWRFSGDGRTEAGTEVEATLEPAGDDRARLTLRHAHVQAVTAAVYGAGWEDVLTNLAGAVGEETSLIGEHAYLGKAADPARSDAALEEYRRVEAALVQARMLRAGNRSAVHLERLLDAPREVVWDALTLPDRIGRWLWPVVAWPDDPARERRLLPGDTFTLGDENVQGGAHEMEVLELEDGRLFAFTWGPDRSSVRIRLADDAAGTLLTLDQEAIPDVFGGGRMRSAPDFAAGWHSLVDGLTLLLAGLSVPEPGGLWDAAYAVYVETEAARPDGISAR